MKIRFSVLYNTKSDVVKAVSAFLTAAVPLFLVFQDDGVTSGEWFKILVPGVLAALAALGFYNAPPTPPYNEGGYIVPGGNQS